MKGIAYLPSIIKLELEQLPKRSQNGQSSPCFQATGSVSNKSNKSQRSCSYKEASQKQCTPRAQTGTVFWGKGLHCCFLAWLCLEAAAWPCCEGCTCSLRAYTISLGVLSCPLWPALTSALLCWIQSSQRDARQEKIKASCGGIKKKVTWIYKRNKNHICQLLFEKCIIKKK